MRHRKVRDRWTRADRLTAFGIVVGVLTLIAAALVVPEIRRTLKLEQEAKERTAARAAMVRSLPVPVPSPSSNQPALEIENGLTSTRAASISSADDTHRVSPKSKMTQAKPIVADGKYKVAAWSNKRGEFFARVSIGSVKRQESGEIDVVIRLFNDTAAEFQVVAFCDLGREGEFAEVDKYELVGTGGVHNGFTSYGLLGASQFMSGCLAGPAIPGESFVFEMQFPVTLGGGALKLVHRRMYTTLDEVRRQPHETVVLGDFEIPIQIQ